MKLGVLSKVFSRPTVEAVFDAIAAVCQQLGTAIIAICLGTRDRENMWRYHPENGSLKNPLFSWRKYDGNL